MTALDVLLEKTSRTFALAIPLLPEPTHREVTIAYLLFRTADTFEDAPDWTAEEKAAALAAFCDVLRSPSIERAEALSRDWVSQRPATHEGYLQLLAEFAGVLDAHLALSEEAREEITQHVIRSAEGMSRIVRREGGVELESIDELREYCYIVAGIVGEMLTELFLLGRPRLEPVAAALRQRAKLFGEALQLVNILKDSEVDASEGRVYLPRNTSRCEVFDLAREDLGAASEYVLSLQSAGAPRGIVAFTALPLELAWAALDRIERDGPGSKISRPEVYRITRRVKSALGRNEPAVRGHALQKAR
ncbi:MAG: squalene/phytoene synthase family protein [Thermoanaerobaculia bacterium]